MPRMWSRLKPDAGPDWTRCVRPRKVLPSMVLTSPTRVTALALARSSSRGGLVYPSQRSANRRLRQSLALENPLVRQHTRASIHRPLSPIAVNDPARRALRSTHRHSHGQMITNSASSPRVSTPGEQFEKTGPARRASSTREVAPKGAWHSGRGTPSEMLV